MWGCGLIWVGSGGLRTGGEVAFCGERWVSHHQGCWFSVGWPSVACSCCALRIAGHRPDTWASVASSSKRRTTTTAAPSPPSPPGASCSAYILVCGKPNFRFYEVLLFVHHVDRCMCHTCKPNSQPFLFYSVSCIGLLDDESPPSSPFVSSFNSFWPNSALTAADERSAVSASE